MESDLSTLSPPARLAIAYARVDLRAAWGLLLAFDDRLAGILGRSSEPIFAQMKIAWWQEALGKPAQLRPQGEPLLAELRQLEEGGNAQGVIAAMLLLLDAWGVLAAHEEWTADALQAFGEARSKAVFGTYRDWVGSGEAVTEIGQGWAIDDLTVRFGEEFGKRNGGGSYRLRRQLRPLSILAKSLGPDVSGVQLIWHALTGR